MKTFRFLLLLAAAACLLTAQEPTEHWMLVLEGPALQGRTAAQKGPATRQATVDQERRITDEQNTLRTALAEREIKVLGATRHLTNMLVVAAPESQLPMLESLPGVARVVKSRRLELHMDQAISLTAVQQAWESLGGAGNAGAGIKIGIIDTGIDDLHPAFQDQSLPIPQGYPLPANSPFVNNKILVARSYVDFFSNEGNADFSHPDDRTPYDLVGHGTAVAMIAAGVRYNSPRGVVSGVAPKAYLGNYKVYGSPGINDPSQDTTQFAYSDAIVQALDDAYFDGMDVALVALGAPAVWGPLDQGQVCGLPSNVYCDYIVNAVEIAIQNGMQVVVSAGNDGDLSEYYPAWNSIQSPGSAPAAITVGATTNSHTFHESVRMTGGDAPSSLHVIPAEMGDGTLIGEPLGGFVRDVATTGQGGFACDPLAANSLAGNIAVVDRGGCNYDQKINNAQAAGAIGVIIVLDYDGELPTLTGLKETGIPAFLIGASDGASLRAYLAGGPKPGALFPQLIEFPSSPDVVAISSSRGPGIGKGYIKPELVAPGDRLYVATQSYDPNGKYWSPDGATAVEGSSFSAAMVAGAAALVLQQHPDYSPAQLKSALVNTTTDGVLDDLGAGLIPASMRAAGAGKLNADNAVRSNLTAEPATVSFGEVDQFLASQVVHITNTGSQALSLTLSIDTTNASLSISHHSINLGPGNSVDVTVSVTSPPSPGVYEAFLVINGAATPFRIPVMYLRSDGIPDNLLWLSSYVFAGNPNNLVPDDLLLKVIDQYGLPVQGAGITFGSSAGGSIGNSSPNTDALGIAYAQGVLGSQPGDYVFNADVANRPDLSITFEGRARPQPVISDGGAVNAANNKLGQGLAPGSYVSLYGANLAATTRAFNTFYLPMSLADVSVSFDIPTQGVSYPGRIQFVSPGQMNIFVPWELLPYLVQNGISVVQMKTSIGRQTSSASYYFPLNAYSPAFFERADPGGTNQQVIAARDIDYNEIGSNNPAQPGSTIQLYANGLGPVTNSPFTGEPAAVDGTLSETCALDAGGACPLQKPLVTIGGRVVDVTFSGLSPGSIGLYQVNVVVPNDLAPGVYRVIITIGGVSSTAAFLFVG